jgi:hypothetical protein
MSLSFLQENRSVLYRISHGINYYDRMTNTKRIHSEYNAIQKLPPVRKQKRLKEINMLTINVSSTAKIKNGKPCMHCLWDMLTLPPKKGYVIKYVYYSDGTGNIVKEKLTSLINSGDFHISGANKLKKYHDHPLLKIK